MRTAFESDQLTALSRRSCWVIGIAAIAIAATVPSAAFAQDTSDGAQPKQPTTTASTGSATPAGDGQGVPQGDIVVTAQRDASLASKTPIAITAIGGADLLNRGVTNPLQLANEVPSLEINRFFGLQLTIRGVTNSDTTAKGDPSAAFLLNGVYIARTQAQETSFFDIDRVEVLRGPQGTLFGRNSTAGVINVITNRPTDQFEVIGNIGYGNFNTFQTDVAVNVPVGDKAAFRLAGSIDRRDTCFKDEPGERYDASPFKDNKSLRLSGSWNPTEDISVLLIGDYTSLKGIPQQFIDGGGFYAPINGDPSNRAYVENLSTSQRLRRGYLQQIDPYADDHSYGIHGEVAWNMGPVTATYIGSYRRFTMDEAYTDYLGGVAITYTNQEYNQDSHELRFSLNDVGRLKLQVGGQYFNESSFQYFDQPNYFGLDHFILDYGPTKAKSYAFFGQATYSLTDALRVTGGIRYTHDDKSQVGLVIFKLAPFPDGTSVSGSAVDFSKVTWRLGLDYDLNEQNLLYANISTGYKAGGFNDGCIAGTSPGGNACNNPIPAEFLFYNPETITAYEAGLKGHTANNVFRYALSAYYYDYRNLQLSTTADIGLGVPTQLIQNAGKARIYGLEFEGTVHPSPRHELSAFGSFLDAKYVSYFPLGPTGPDYGGRHLDRTPGFSATGSYTYTLPLNSGAAIAFNLRSKISDHYYLGSASTVQQLKEPSYTRTDASITFNAPSDVWYVQAYVHNIENEVQMSAVTNIAGFLAVAPTDPRTYGVRGGFRF